VQGLLLILGLLLAACTQPLRGIDDQSPFVTWPAPADREEKRFLLQYPQLATRDGPRLVLWFANSSVTFENTPEEHCDSVECKRYIVVGYWPEREAFLVDIPYLEGYSSALVYSDAMIHMVSRPRFSPSGRMFMTFSSDCAYGDGGVLDIWDFKSKKPETLFRFERSGFTIDNAIWIDEDRIDTEPSRDSLCLEMYERASPMTFRRVNGYWSAKETR
jgi:hypothetical protein